LGWQWHRFLGDAWGNAATPFADAPLFLAMTDSLSLAGTSAMTQQTGRSFDQLFEDLVVAISVHKAGQSAAREFSTWNLVTVTNIFQGPPEVAPPGTYPWPVTVTSIQSGSSAAAFVTGVYSCPPQLVDTLYVLPAEGERCAIGPSGMRFHDFVSSGTGAGAQILVTGAESGKIIVTRLR